MGVSAQLWRKASLCQHATDSKTVKTLSQHSPLGSTMLSYLPEQDLFINTHRCARAKAEEDAFGINPLLCEFGWDEKKRESRSAEKRGQRVR